MSTVVTVEGNLTADPVHTTTRNRPDVEPDASDTAGTSVTNLRIAVSDRVRDETGDWHDTKPEFHDVVIWGTPAIHAARTFRRGDRVVVHGRQKLRSWAGEDGITRRTTITATMIGASVRFTAATLPRGERTFAPSASGPATLLGRAG